MRLSLFFLLSLGLVACNPATQNEQSQSAETTVKTFVYDFNNPKATFTLPKILEEISGLAYYKNQQLLCVQDEKGDVFVYDLAQQKIVATHNFDLPDDYEGVELVGDEVFVLKSNGNLLAFKLGEKQTNDIKTNLPGKNDVEGLGFDPVTKRLLLAVKESSKKGKVEESKVIYSFDLKNRAIWTERVLTQKQFEGSGMKEKAWRDFKPSGLAVHPQTGDWYLLSSAGKKIVILDQEGKVKQIENLDPLLFRQPEGICFAPDGTLYIASEGDGGMGYVLQFDNSPKPL